MQQPEDMGITGPIRHECSRLSARSAPYNTAGVTGTGASLVLFIFIVESLKRFHCVLDPCRSQKSWLLKSWTFLNNAGVRLCDSESRQRICA